MSFKSRVVFSYNADEIIREFAKKNSETDIAVYSRKSGESITTFLSPSRFPDKVSSLTDALYPSQINLVSVKAINRELAEVLVALSLAGKKQSIFLLDDGIDSGRFERLLNDAGITSYEFTEERGLALAERIERIDTAQAESELKVVVDQAFKVRGVGTVALGFVMSGILRKHDLLHISYSGKSTQVKSIQMQDIDVSEANTGSRVGIALKNVDVDDLGRGTVLSVNPITEKDILEGEIVYHNSLKSRLQMDSEVFVSDCMRYQRGKLSERSVKLDRPLAITEHEYLLSNPNITPRVFGKIMINAGI